MKYTYTPKGVCSQQFICELEKGIITNFQIVGGCPGNTQAVSKLIVGKRPDEVIPVLKGIDCRGKGTSCPDQVARFLETIKNK